MLSDINQITDTIYLGNIEGAFNIKKLQSLGIKKSFNSNECFRKSLQQS